MAASNVFVVSRDPGKESVTSAKGAHLAVIKGQRMVILEDGQRMETRSDDGSVRITEFKEYGVQVDNDNPVAIEEMAARSMPTKDLIGKDEPIARSVLAWRWACPCRAELRHSGPGHLQREPACGSSSLMIALFAFIVYYNLMTLGESWVSANKIGMWAFWACCTAASSRSACWCCWRATSAGRRAICCSAQAPQESAR
jgi:lipopolysaccharide export system permease protein